MKKNTMIGTLALSAALAMGTAIPAFAAESVGEDLGDFTDANNSTTTVQLEAVASQINATIPLNVTVVADIDGAEQMITPSQGAYKIVNKSTSGKLFVTGVEATLSNTSSNVKWNAADSDDPATVSPTPVTTPAAKYGSVCLTLTSGELKEGTGSNAGTQVFKSESDPIVLVGANPNTAPEEWVVPKATADADGELGLKLYGGNSHLSGLDTEANAEELVKVKYTVTMSVPTA